MPDRDEYIKITRTCRAAVFISYMHRLTGQKLFPDQIDYVVLCLRDRAVSLSFRYINFTTYCRKLNCFFSKFSKVLPRIPLCRGPADPSLREPL